jgi:hypothetical protein
VPIADGLGRKAEHTSFLPLMDIKFCKCVQTFFPIFRNPPNAFHPLKPHICHQDLP